MLLFNRRVLNNNLVINPGVYYPGKEFIDLYGQPLFRVLIFFLLLVLAILSDINFLLIMILLPVFSVLLLQRIEKLENFYLFAYGSSALIFIYTLFLMFDFANFHICESSIHGSSVPKFWHATFLERFLFSYSARLYSFLGLNYTIGIDGLSLMFLFLTNFLILICIYLSKSFVKIYFRWFIYLFILIQFFLIQFFVLLNLFFFYIVFEALLIPMFFIIGIWGSRSRKAFAAYLFFLFTFFGSILMLFSIIILFTVSSDLDFVTLIFATENLPPTLRSVLFIFLFIGFSIKVPMFPFHLWLPEAHVEAPTLGSVILAGILLKLGGYGMLRFLIPLFPAQFFQFRNFIFVLCIVSVIYSAFIGICQLDLKKIVAYSSITHMNFSIAGLFANDIMALQGSIYSMFSHGFISAALFLLVGVLYERYKTRLIAYYTGLISVMPVFSFFLFFFFIANVGLPPLSGFVAEIMILLGLVIGSNKLVVFLLFFSSIIITVNFFWVFNRICMGPLSLHLNKIREISKLELCALSILALYVIFIGLWPNGILVYTKDFSEFLLIILNR